MDFSEITNGILQGLENWESKLNKLSDETIMSKRNKLHLDEIQDLIGK
jgi:hypothetical protein